MIDLASIGCYQINDKCPDELTTKVYHHSELTMEILHSVCFINNVYKQRFFQLVKIFQNLNNRTSQNLYVKQRMNQMKTRIQFSSGPSSIFRLAVRFQQIIFFRHHKCRMQISVPILTLINTNPSQVSFILLPSIK